jgi:hypothetical protein
MHAPSDCLSLPNINQLTKSGENFRRSIGENCIGFVYNFENIVKRETLKMEQPSVNGIFFGENDFCDFAGGFGENG